MRFKKIIYKNVAENGDHTDKKGIFGNVVTEGMIQHGHSGSLGHWYFTSILPISKKGTVRGIKIIFSNREEYTYYMSKKIQ